MGPLVLIDATDSVLPPPDMLTGLVVLVIAATLWLTSLGLALFSRSWRWAASLVVSVGVFVAVTVLVAIGIAVLKRAYGA